MNNGPYRGVAPAVQKFDACSHAEALLRFAEWDGKLCLNRRSFSTISPEEEKSTWILHLPAFVIRRYKPSDTLLLFDCTRWFLPIAPKCWSNSSISTRPGRTRIAWR